MLPANVQASERPIIVYEKAVAAIQECSTLLEAKHWNNKAEALGAWAKIYADDRVEREARALKLHAYRQIGRLADTMQVSKPIGKGGYKGVSGSTKGARNLLMGHGFAPGRAQHCLTIGRLQETVFQRAVNRRKPPSPTQLCDRDLRPNPMWAEVGNRMSIFLSSTKKFSPEKLAETMDEKQRRKALRMISDARVWLDDLETLLEKELESA